MICFSCFSLWSWEHDNHRVTWVTHVSLAFCAWDLSFSLHGFYDLNRKKGSAEAAEAKKSMTKPRKNSGNACAVCDMAMATFLRSYNILQHIVSHHVALPLSTQNMLSITVWGEKPSQLSAALAFVHFVYSSWSDTNRLKLELSNWDSSQTSNDSGFLPFSTAFGHVPNASLISNTCSRLSIQHDPATVLLVRRP